MVFQAATVRRIRSILTVWQSYVLQKCYSDGYSEAEIAEFMGVRRDVVCTMLKRACDKLQVAGFPRPQPHGRGSREEFRRMLPELDHLTREAV